MAEIAPNPAPQRRPRRQRQAGCRGTSLVEFVCWTVVFAVCSGILLSAYREPLAAFLAAVIAALVPPRF